jgi:hypothetical protein
MDNVSYQNVIMLLIVNTNVPTLEPLNLCALTAFRMVIVQIMVCVLITAV